MQLLPQTEVYEPQVERQKWYMQDEEGVVAVCRLIMMLKGANKGSMQAVDWSLTAWVQG